MLLVGLAVFVTAEISEDFGGNHEVNLKQGWNLVSVYAPSSDLFDVRRGNQDLINSLSDKGITAIFFYDKYNSKYIQLYPDNPNKESDVQNYFANMGDPEQGGDIGRYGAFVNSAVWVYSKKTRSLEFYSVDGPLYVKNVKLRSGWNFLTITPEMTDKSLKDLEGGCSITNAYLWDEDNQQWGTISNLLDDRNILNNEGGLWNGLIVKVSNDCSMGGSSITPPPLPDTVINLPPETTPESSDINFPETIGEFTLKSKNTNDKTECGELNGNTVCVQMSRIEYVTSDNRAVHILPTKITSGKESYINYIKTSASESNVDGVSGVYRGAEPWELYWFTNNDYDMIGTQDYKYIPQADGGYNSQTLSGTTTTSVAKWLLNKYSPAIN